VSRGRNLKRSNKPDTVILSGKRLDQMQTSLDVARHLIKLGQHEADNYRLESALDKAEAAVDRARGFIADAVEAIRDDKEGSGGATAAQLRRAYVARSYGRLANPFEDSEWR
jgi:hypothetical protein